MIYTLAVTFTVLQATMMLDTHMVVECNSIFLHLRRTMYYYKFHISDYKSHTGHLTPIEDICYRRLLDWYFLHEKTIPNDLTIVSRFLGLSEYSTSVEQVLNEFFNKTKNGWINKRADEEINLYKYLKSNLM